MCLSSSKNIANEFTQFKFQKLYYQKFNKILIAFSLSNIYNYVTSLICHQSTYVRPHPFLFLLPSLSPSSITLSMNVIGTPPNDPSLSHHPLLPLQSNSKSCLNDHVLNHISHTKRIIKHSFTFVLIDLLFMANNNPLLLCIYANHCKEW